jgi:hypothetical protein
MHDPKSAPPNLSDETILAILREAAEDARQLTDRTRTLVRETHALLRKAERLRTPLIESR